MLSRANLRDKRHIGLVDTLDIIVQEIVVFDLVEFVLSIVPRWFSTLRAYELVYFTEESCR